MLSLIKQLHPVIQKHVFPRIIHDSNLSYRALFKVYYISAFIVISWHLFLGIHGGNIYNKIIVMLKYIVMVLLCALTCCNATTEPSIDTMINLLPGWIHKSIT